MHFDLILCKQSEQELDHQVQYILENLSIENHYGSGTVEKYLEEIDHYFQLVNQMYHFNRSQGQGKKYPRN